MRRSRRDYVSAEMSFDFVRNMELAEVLVRYAAQPDQKALANDPSLEWRDLPGNRQRPPMKPPADSLTNNTLIRRGVGGAWDPNDEGYYLVVTHRARPWAKSEIEEQTYAVAVEVSLSTEAQIDLRAAMIRAQADVRTRARAQLQH